MLRLVGIGAGEADAPLRLFRGRRPDLLTVQHPAAVAARRLRRQRREVGTRARLAEQLAPDDLAAQRRQDPTVLLLARPVDDEVRQRPRADHDPGPRDLRGAELLLDHEQFERGGVATPRPRPRRRDVALVDQPGALLGRREVLDLGEERAELGAHRLGRLREIGAERPPAAVPSRHARRRCATCRVRPRARATSSHAAGRRARRAPT